MMDKRPLVVCIAGPTATGKTDAAIDICKRLSGEVLSMDSMQIYQGCDIGTAKPDQAEMRGIPHHLLSIVPPRESFSVAAYQTRATAVMEDVLRRSKLPVFAGGTGLYLQAVSHPLRFTQAGHDEALRSALEAQAATEEGKLALHVQLAAVDPQAAAQLHPNNTRRVIRALMVYQLTGVPMSAQTQEWVAEPEQDWLIFALYWPRAVLYDRINRRVDAMIARGLVDEVQSLLQSGIAPDAQAMQAIGYKEIVGMLSGQYTQPEAVELIKRNTRRYAKRQMTWLRRDARVRWIDLSCFADTQAVSDALIETIQTYRERYHGEN